ncbi:MAG TPA: argininosuccinate synthase [Solirubrobacteraceae bacterium]
MAEQTRTPHTRTASYLAEPGEVHRVLLLYSGGLDTSVMLKWIQDEYEAEVVALTVNLGQPGEDYDVVQGKALSLGAIAAEVVDAREEFARDFVVPAIKANAIYGLAYPLFTALGRPLIAKLAVEYARKHECDTIAHGCTGKGNDQVRIEATVATLAPELKVIAPVRGWQMGREEEIAYARQHGIPIKTHPTQGAEHTPYSIDDNLWGRSSEGRWIEELDHAPDDDVFQLVTRPEEAPDAAEVVNIEFDRGVPVGLNGERLGIVELLERAAELGARHGVGIVDHIEDRIVGLKVRDIYEVPAAAILLPAHAELERLVGTIHQNQFKGELDRKWAYLVYAGLWWEPLRSDLDAYMESVNAQVTGTIGMKLYKGTARVVTRESPNAVYDAALATFETSGGLFSQQASPGFIELWSLQSRMAHRLRSREEG